LDLYRSVVITGGGGMLAQEFDRALRERGVQPFMARRADCDITDRAQVSKLFQARRPTLLLNCAAHTGVDQCEDEPERANAINGDGPGYLAELSREYHSKLVHFSTDFVFSGQNDRPYRPEDTPGPLSIYGKSKLLGEERVKNVTPLSWLTVRTSWLFGRHGNCFPKVIVDRASSGHVLKVVNDQIGCPTYAADLASAVLELLDRGAQGIWHITNASATSWYDFAKSIVEEFGISAAEVKPISTAQWVAMRPRQAKRPAYSVLDLEPYAKLTGRRMRDWRDALRDYRTEVQKGS
jgi:dTDP-4-dehydrorhamnose reductase